ncbi:MAG: hypothetical protein JWM02_147 [Frankiales bacterium]|nr:hypothetical protein [Frankiales bacterium]
MRTRPHWAGELLVVAFLLVIYDQVAGLAKVRAAVAFQHGRDLLSLSPAGLEKRADHWLAGVHWLRDPAAYYYDLAHIDVTLAVFLVCFVFCAPVYRRARTALVLINLIGLGVFLLYPVAPPRLLPGAGFVDIVAASKTWGAWEAGGGVADRANEFGSLPSLHAAWAIWVALTVMSMTTRRSLRTLAWAHVVMTFVVVIVTGNHYLVDIAAGALVVAVAWALAPVLAVRRSSVRAVEPAVAVD